MLGNNAPNITQIWNTLQDAVRAINNLQQTSITNTSNIVTAIHGINVTPVYFSTLWTPGTIANNSSVNRTISPATGAVLGAFVQAAFLADLQGCIISGYVPSADNVVVVITNDTGAPVTLGSAVVQVILTII